MNFGQVSDSVFEVLCGGGGGYGGVSWLLDSLVVSLTFECWASNVEELKMCDYGLLVISRYVERCGGQHIPISVLSEENRLEVFQILTPARCDDVSRLSQLSICSKHLKLSNEVFKSLKKKTKCQLEACEKKKDRSVTAHQSWAIFHKTHTHVLPGSPICWAHRREVNGWIADCGDEEGVQVVGALEENELSLQGDEEEENRDALVDQAGGEEEKGDGLVDQNVGEEEKCDALVNQDGGEEEQTDALLDQEGSRVEVAVFEGGVGGMSPVSKKRKALLR